MRSTLSVKGLTPEARASYLLWLGQKAGVRRVVAADASGWDASWRHEHLHAWARRWCHGPWECLKGYDTLPHLTRWATGSVLIGAGNNSFFNCIENGGARRTAWKQVRGEDFVPDMVVEGDDALDFVTAGEWEMEQLDE